MFLRRIKDFVLVFMRQCSGSYKGGVSIPFIKSHEFGGKGHEN